MSRTAILKSILAGTAATLMASAANAENFNIPAGDLASARDAYSAQTGISLMVSSDAVRGLKTRGAKGDLTANDALSRILSGTGFATRRYSTDSVAIIRNGERQSEAIVNTPMQLAQAVPATRASVETVTVTSSKLGGADVQSIPIAITALSQEQLTSTQTAGGPDLVKQVPNLTFSKTNFTGYNIQIRGIGTQAISVTTDPAVAVALNDIPFIRNHFFEQEFFDLSQAEVLRGPQGTLYGRNATAGVVNLTTAKPTDQFEAMASADIGNYKNRRFEGMINIPIVDDRLDIRIAGEWTKRDGYTYNETLGTQVDGRNLWSGRISVSFKPTPQLQADLVWEHFQEDDNRLRSGKQLCKRDPGPDSVGPVNQDIHLPAEFLNNAIDVSPGDFVTNLDNSGHAVLSQGCLLVSLYSPEAYETPNGQALPIVYAVQYGNSFQGLIPPGDPYLSTTQPRNLRVIQSELTPRYKAKNDTIELNLSYHISPSLVVISNSGYNNDFLVSIEDFNRFNSRPGIFFSSPGDPDPFSAGHVGDTGLPFSPGGVFCDPQLGCSTKFVGADLSQEKAFQISQEFRISSDFKGPINFSFGGNYLHYETLEDFYVFLNLITLETRFQDLVSPKTANEQCFLGPARHVYTGFGQSYPLIGCPFTDGTPLTPGFDGQGHNYFRSENPYRLNSYAGFGEAYYQILSSLKLTGGLRWTDDQKTFVEIPSQVLANGFGYPVQGVVNQEWTEWTGRAVVNWTPKLDFTDQTLIYASFSHGYKAGGANPPGPNTFTNSAASESNHPLSFAPEFVNSYEIGTKNALFDGAVTLNGTLFHYDYKGYQISEIVDRTSINLNFDATVNGAEIESTWEPVPGLRFNFAGGWEDTSLAKGSKAIDLMDRTAGHPGWMIVKPSILSTSNCILPDYVVAELILASRHKMRPDGEQISSLGGAACEDEYSLGLDAVQAADGAFPPSGFDPSTAPNGGAGFDKDLSGNK
jgi:outer membrane receptor protein involved in Fe transport